VKEETGIEAPTIGSHNIFGIKSRVSPHVAVGSNCVVGAGCVVLPDPFKSFSPPTPAPTPPSQTPAPPTDSTAAEDPAHSPSSDVDMASPSPSAASSAPPPPSQQPSHDLLPSSTHVFGSESRRRLASGEGQGQARALFVKHWEYLRETLPKYHKLKMFQ
jgi:dynactin-6